jgi:predicted amidohydrolase
VAAEAGIGIVYGFAERASDGRVFNAAQFVDAGGVRHGAYRKTHLFGGLDRANYSASDGAGPLFEINGWRFGCLICYDAEFPEAVRQVALRGADVVVVPTANMIGFDTVSLLLVPARAYENQCFVVYANCCGSEGRLDYCGTSVVAAPDGTLLARADRDETLLYATLDPAHPGRSLNTYLADRLPGAYAALVDCAPARSQSTTSPALRSGGNTG